MATVAADPTVDRSRESGLRDSGDEPGSGIADRIDEESSTEGLGDRVLPQQVLLEQSCDGFQGALEFVQRGAPEPARLPRSASTRQVEEVTRYLERAAAQRFPARRARDSRDVEVLARHQSDDLPAVCPALRSGCSHAILTGPKIPL